MSCSGRLVNLAMSCKHPSNASLARARSRSAQAVIMAIGMASNSLVASSMQPQFANTISIANHYTRLLSGMPSNRKSRDLNSRLSRTWRRGVGRQGEALEAAQPLVYGSQDFPGTAAATILPLANMSGSLVPGSGQDPRLFQEQRRRLSGRLEMDPRNFADDVLGRHASEGPEQIPLELKHHCVGVRMQGGFEWSKALSPSTQSV
ncbi:hypothetical protein SELMODRAFT_404867 [Selaginella moellendorffii]|uniref:Uncharacterized protein n=1 Tax=Selaginella moellendorffii TaxID=88036 RepID=D8QXL8_SELML|nr:hypothetical protein SELMODRAFT_404867 [Selaginella moellendorffii]